LPSEVKAIEPVGGERPGGHVQLHQVEAPAEHHRRAVAGQRRLRDAVVGAVLRADARDAPLLAAVEAALIDVEGPVGVADVVVRVPRRRPDRVHPRDVLEVLAVRADAHRLRRVLAQVGHPQLQRRGTAVALAAPACAAAREQELRAVGRQRRARHARVEQHARRRIALEVEHVGAPRLGAVVAAVGAAQHQQALAVVREAQERVADRARGHLLRHAALDRDEVDLRVAGAVALECDVLAVGAEERRLVVGGVDRQAARDAAVAGSDPEVAAPGEGDRRAVGGDGGVAGQADLMRVGRRSAEERETEQCGTSEHGDLLSCSGLERAPAAGRRHHRRSIVGRGHSTP